MKHIVSIFVIFALVLTACAPPAVEQTTRPISNTSDSRLKIIETTLFLDARGYNRDILLIHDTKTGQDFIAVMGAGVTSIETTQECKLEPSTNTIKCTTKTTEVP